MNAYESSCGWVMSHKNEFCLIWIVVWTSHVSYEWVLSHLNRRTDESCLVWIVHVAAVEGEWGNCQRSWMNHVSYGWVMSHMNESCLTWMSHVSGVEGEWSNCQRCELAWMSHVSLRMSSVSCESSYRWVMSRMNESCVIRMSSVSCELSYRWVMYHMKGSRLRCNRMNGYCLRCAPMNEWGPTHYFREPTNRSHPIALGENDRVKASCGTYESCGKRAL